MTSKSSITTRKGLKNWHPGEILLEDFLKPLGVSQYALAKAIGVPAQRIGDIVHARRAITPDTALRLAFYFGMEAAFWLNLQTRYDLEEAERTLGPQLAQEITPRAA